MKRISLLIMQCLNCWVRYSHMYMSMYTCVGNIEMLVNSLYVQKLGLRYVMSPPSPQTSNVQCEMVD
mgnify:CR=1 FL=1